MNKLKKLIHYHTCTLGGKPAGGLMHPRHRWRHAGFCEERIQACPSHLSDFYHKRDHPQPSPNVLAQEKAYQADKARAEKFENYLYTSDSTTIDPDPINTGYKKMMQFLYDNIEKQED